MEIGAPQAVASANRQVATQQAERPQQAENQEDENQSPANAAATSNQTADVSATQRVQPANETEASQAASSNNQPPEPDPNSREGVGRFIDTVV